jgi:hypothetical protein
MSKNNYHSIVLTLGIITASFSSLSAVQPVVEDMQQAAVAFLDSLSPELKQKATFPLNDDERVNWHFVPKTGGPARIEPQSPRSQQSKKYSESGVSFIYA